MKRHAAAGCRLSDVVGGEATADNITLRCRAHNTHEARLFFGADSVVDARATHLE